jgi:dihydrofolate reductase
MRKLIAGMKVSLDSKTAGPEGVADWVHGWSEDYGLTPRIDACLLGAGMYPGYEQYWTQIQRLPDEVSAMTGTVPTRGEVEWARVAAQTPHYVLSSTLTRAEWPQTGFVTKLHEIDALKRRSGKDIYLVGGGRTTASLIDAGLVDELRLIVYPLLAGDGPSLFATTTRRVGLELHDVESLVDGRLSLVYGLGSGS